GAHPRPVLGDVVGVDSVFDGAQPGVVDPGGDLVLADVHQHHNGAVQEPRRVGHVLPGPARRAAVDGLKHGAVVADVSRPGQADAARDLRGQVGRDVAVQVGHDHHVELLRRVRQFGHADVDDPVLLLDVRILGPDLVEDLVEKAVGHLHNVVLGHAGDFAAVVRPGVLKGVADDLLRARPADKLERRGHVGRLLVLDAGVGVFLVLPDDDHVHVGVLGRDERVVRHAWAHIGVKPQHLTGRHVEALVPAALG